MADFYQRIVDMQGTVEDIIRRIPGISELVERGDRRAADELLREQLARRFEEQMARFDQLKQQLIDETGLEHMERVQTVDTKMRAFIGRIETAADGYSGLFSRVPVNSESLERLYAFDNALFTYLDQFAAGLSELERAINSSGEMDIKDILRQLDSIATEANNVFKQRVEVLTDLQDSV